MLTETVKYPWFHSSSLKSHIKIMRIHYQAITGYRELPPKWRIISDSPDPRDPDERYLAQVDELMQEARAGRQYGPADDILSIVLANQTLPQEVQTRHLARLLAARHAMTERHLKDIRGQLYGLRSWRPLRLYGPGAGTPEVTDLDKHIMNLERQERALEVAHWRDTHELSTELLTQRAELHATQRRIGYLTGGYGVVGEEHARY